MTRYLQHVLANKLLVLSVAANVCLLVACFVLLSSLKETYADYRHFRALPIGTSGPVSKGFSQVIESTQADSALQKIVLFGDSRIEAWHPAPATANTIFINAGVSGETTSEIKRRFERDVVRLAPDYVVLQAGMNDLTASVTKGIEDPELLIDTMHSNMQYFISTLESSGINVIVTSIIPNRHLNFTRKIFWLNTLTEKVQQANAKLQQTTVSLGADWLDLDPLYLDQKGDPINDLFFDTLHLNEKGYVLLNRELNIYLEAL